MKLPAESFRVKTTGALVGFSTYTPAGYRVCTAVFGMSTSEPVSVTKPLSIVGAAIAISSHGSGVHSAWAQRQECGRAHEKRKGLRRPAASCGALRRQFESRRLEFARRYA